MSASVSATVRRVAAAAVAAAAVVGAVALPASAADHDHDHDHGRSYRSQVVIGGVQHPSARYDRSLNREWVEVTNQGRRDLNLDGWTLSDEDGNTYTFRHYRLEGRSTVRVHTGYGRDSRNDLYQDRRTSVWDDRHDTATLRNEYGRFVDSASWGYDHRGHRDGGWHGRHR
ncbi:lamin tail domain-containing protein [Streptomyces sp. NPDC007905]|uniref:lamin tail domain-containing protein n=1 Tax=Streptomyces sp. NPDC007905 TaxID=3364788 RepID=UPI0036EC7B90